jgi:hypothetical protein
MTREPGRHRADGGSASGRIVWHRFGLVLTPALIALVLLGVGAATGAVPVALAVEGEQSLKVTAKSYSADMGATFPSFVPGTDGGKDTVLVLSLRNLDVDGLCVSTKVDTPMGPYVLRMTTPDAGAPVKAGDVTLAIQDFRGLDLSSDRLSANTRTPHRPGAGSLAAIGASDSVPLTFDQLRVGVNVTVRWITANQLQLTGLNLAGNLSQRECA